MGQDTLFGRMFAFTNRSMPDEPQGPYQTAGLLLRILGWFALVYAAIAMVALIFAMFAVLVLGSAVDAMPWGDWWGGWGGAFAAVAAVAIFFALIFVVLVGGGILFWLGWTYDHWRLRDRRALGHFLAWGIILTVFGALGVLGGISSLDAADGPDLFTGGLPALVELGFGIAFLVLHSNSQVKQAFEDPPVAEAPESQAGST